MKKQIIFVIIQLSFIYLGLFSCMSSSSKDNIATIKQDNEKERGIVWINTHSKDYNVEDFLEFDIKLTKEQKSKRKRRNAIGAEKEWPKYSDGMVYVPIDVRAELSPEVIRDLKASIEDFNQNTCIRFIPWSGYEKDYVQVFRFSGCWADLGRKGGAQWLSLGEGCHTKGIVVHELMHVLGFWHEHTRPDRDEHIFVDFTNIREDWVKQYELTPYGGSFVQGEEYDFNSMMHYENNAGGEISEDRPVLSAKHDPTMKLGPIDSFSEQDLHKINLKYKCGKKYVKHD